MERREEPGRDARPSELEERRRAAENISAQLEQRDVRVDGSESGEELVEMLEAAERFESARAALGASSMTNASDSSSPDDARLVLPGRRADERPRAWAARVRAAADSLPPS